MAADHLYRQNLVACVWDFDKTLIPGYMQTPLFDYFGVDEKAFWAEVNELPARYAARGQRVSADGVYLNHLLSAVRGGQMKGLNNRLLRELGKQLRFYAGLPGLFAELRELVRSRPEYRKHDIELEHYVISTGIAEMIRGSAIAPFVEDIYGCEFLENPLPVGFSRQPGLPIEEAQEISQIGLIVDNTVKTRFIFEINKGTNKNPEIDVNAKVAHQDRRVPIENMIYVADGPSDVPVFAIVRDKGGKAFAVYNPDRPDEFAQNDALLQAGRINAYGPADYTPKSSTTRWLTMHVLQICDRLVREREAAMASRVSRPPRHLHPPEANRAAPAEPAAPAQEALFDDEL